LKWHEALVLTGQCELAIFTSPGLSR
jgi:hypothetical protein